MERKVFEKPTAEISMFEVQDIITTSGDDSGVNLPLHPWDE